LKTEEKDQNNAPQSYFLNYNVSFVPEMSPIQFTSYQQQQKLSLLRSSKYMLIAKTGIDSTSLNKN